MMLLAAMMFMFTSCTTVDSGEIGIKLKVKVLFITYSKKFI